MMLLKLVDGTTIEITPSMAEELIPYRPVYASKWLRDPITATFYYRGKLIPILGPVPESESKDYFILLVDNYAHIIDGVPQFEDELASAPGTTEESAASGPADHLAA